MSHKDFIDEIGGLVIAGCKKHGYKWPSAIIAQACVESNYGISKLGSEFHNYFGMKCGGSWEGRRVTMDTFEEVNGELVPQADDFRAYDSMEDGVEGYFDFIDWSLYENLHYATSSYDYLCMIKADGYATSSSYAPLCWNVVKLYDLEFFDRILAGEVDPEPVESYTLAEVVDAVIRGDFGNGEDRKAALANAGYNYDIVQQCVDAKLSNKRAATIAKEVIQGKWSNYPERKEWIEAAGYNYEKVQGIVDSLMEG